MLETAAVRNGDDEREMCIRDRFGAKGKGLSELTKNKIEALDLPGIDFVESFKSYYPKGDIASYTVGYENKMYITVKFQKA